MFSLAASPLWANEITLDSNTALSTEGYFVLSWHPDLSTSNLSSSASPSFENVTLLQADNEAMTAAKRRHNIPAQGAITLSGFKNGNYFFRVVTTNASSNIVKVQVTHHSLKKALSFFFVGLILFCILGVCIFLGHKAHSGNTL